LCKRRWQPSFAEGVVSKYFYEEPPLILKCFVLDQHEIGKFSVFDSQSHRRLLCKILYLYSINLQLKNTTQQGLRKIISSLMHVSKMDSMSIYPL
jgi:hypothetical protein